MIGERIYKAMGLAREADRREGVTISSMGYCELQTTNLYVRGITKEISPANLLAMRTGTATHEALFKLLYKWRGELEGFVYKFREREVSIQTPAGNTLKGHLDLYAEIDGKEYVVDLKVIDEGPFSYLEPVEYGGTARQHEIDQVMLYASALGVEDCILVYLCKGGKKSKGLFKEYPFKVDPNRVALLLDKYDRIMAGDVTKPFKDPDESWECGYCPFYSECWGFKPAFEKQDSVIAIPEALELEYIGLKGKADEYDAQAKAVKEKIELWCAGRRGEGKSLTASFIGPSSYDSYDSKKLKVLVDPAVLKKCAKPVSKDGYYTLRMRNV